MKNETIIKQKHETIPDFRIGGYIPDKLHTADPNSYTNSSEEWVYLFTRNKNQIKTKKIIYIIHTYIINVQKMHAPV